MESEHGEAKTPVCGPVCKRIRRKRQKKLLVLLFLDFAKNTTLHGLKYVTEAGLHFIEKVFWLVTFFGSAAICFFFIFNVWQKWQTSPVIVSFDAKHVSVNENPDENKRNTHSDVVFMTDFISNVRCPINTIKAKLSENRCLDNNYVPFPSVTICPNAKFLQEKFNYTKFWDAYIDDINNGMDIVHTDVLLKAETLSLLCDVNYYTNTIDQTATYEHFNASAMEFLYKMFVDFDEVFGNCKWRGNFALCEEIFQKVLTKLGICFNFNGLQGTDILNMNFVQREFNYTFARKEIRNWTMEHGYSSNSYEYVYPHRGRENGGQPNLKILLKDLDAKKDKKCNSLYNGYKIYLHHPADLPQALMYSFSAVPDQVTSMGVTFTMDTANINIKRHPVEIRQCYFADEMPLNYFRMYTYNNCMLECITSFTFKQCNCVPFYMPYNDSAKICSSSKMTCAITAEFQFTELEGLNEGRCKCLPSCDSIVYDAYTVKSHLNFEAFLAAHKSILDSAGPKKFVGSSLVEIFFKQSTFRTVHHSELYGLTDFLGNCGGLLGLFLGFSWLSLVEILYFLTFRVYKTIKTDLKQENAGRWNEVLQKVNASKNQ